MSVCVRCVCGGGGVRIVVCVCMFCVCVCVAYAVRVCVCVLCLCVVCACASQTHKWCCGREGRCPHPELSGPSSRSGKAWTPNRVRVKMKGTTLGREW